MCIFQNHRRQSEFESAGLTGTWGGCRRRNAKIWGKNGRFCKNLAKTGGLLSFRDFRHYMAFFQLKNESPIGGLHMTSSKTWLCKLWSICPKFLYGLQDHKTCLCTKFEAIWTNENRVTGKTRWGIFYYVIWENRLGAFSCPPTWLPL